jgi:hypothetical protein
MKTIFNPSGKKLIGFFVVYFLLMASLIGGVIYGKQQPKENNKAVVEVGKSFKEELQGYEKKKELREAEISDRWRPSNRFVMIALTASSVLDIIIVLLWARHENKKREGGTGYDKPRLTDRKWFWNIVVMGIVQPKNNRIKVNWRNLILFMIAMYILKKTVVDHL